MKNKSPRRNIRIIVIDNDRDSRESFVRTLETWNYQVYSVEGVGVRLIERAREMTQRYRCHLALVDMRLRDNNDHHDRSGLVLAPELLPTKTILVSNFLERVTVRQGLKTDGIFDVFANADPLDDLYEMIERAVDSIALGPERPNIIWPPHIHSAAIRDLLFPGQADIPEDEVDDVVCRVFAGKDLQVREVRLALIEGDDPMSPSPRFSEPVGNIPTLPSLEQLSTLRRQSRVFRVQVDQQLALYVVKIARVDKIQREVAHFKQYVQTGTAASYRPEMFNYALLWDVGAVAYRYLGGAADAIGTLHTFKQVFRRATTAEPLLPPLRNFFDTINWGGFYCNAQPLSQSLFAAYDDLWHGTLSAARISDRWRGEDATRYFPGLPVRLPNPLRWFHTHPDPAGEVRGARRAITHGDLHGDNLFVNHEHAWPIDFERTGDGPILRDFVEIIQDVTTRIAVFTDADLPVIYEFAVAFCAHSTVSALPQPTAAVKAHPEAQKAFDIVSELLRLAHTHTHYTDRRELLWALLFNHLFIASRLKRETPRWLCTILWSSVICGRLERWTDTVWPPAGWSPVVFEPIHRHTESSYPSKAVEFSSNSSQAVATAVADANSMNRSSFQHGYALIIGVGETPHYPAACLPVTVRDAQAIEKVLLDPNRCAYPQAHVQLLADATADRASLLAGLNHLTALAHNDPDATIMIYFSGHGWRTNDGRYALVPSDVRVDQLEHTVLWADEFTSLLQAIPAKRLLVCLDSCHAAGIGTVKGAAAKFIESPPSKDLLSALKQGEGRVIISSSRADQASYYRQDGMLSIFTEHLLEALNGAANRASDTVIKISQVMTHLSEHVPVTVRDMYRAEQNPWIEQSAEDFPIALLYGGKAVLTSTSAPPAVDTVDLQAIYVKLHEMTEPEFTRFVLLYFHDWHIGANANQRLDQRINDLVDWASRKNALSRLAKLLGL